MRKLSIVALGLLCLSTSISVNAKAEESCESLATRLDRAEGNLKGCYLASFNVNACVERYEQVIREIKSTMEGQGC